METQQYKLYKVDSGGGNPYYAYVSGPVSSVFKPATLEEAQAFYKRPTGYYTTGSNTPFKIEKDIPGVASAIDSTKFSSWEEFRKAHSGYLSNGSWYQGGEQGWQNWLNTQVQNGIPQATLNTLISGGKGYSDTVASYQAPWGETLTNVPLSTIQEIEKNQSGVASGQLKMIAPGVYAPAGSNLQLAGSPAYNTMNQQLANQAKTLGAISNNTTSTNSNGVNLTSAQTNAPTTSDANSFVSGLESLIKTQQQMAQDYKAQYDQLNQQVQSQNKTWLDKLTNSKSPAEERLSQYQALGFDPATYFAQAQADIASIKTLQEEYNNLDAQKLAAMQAEDNRLASTGVIDRRKGQIENDYNLKMYQVSGKINAQSAVMAAKQGNFELATNLVSQAVSDYTAGLQLDYKNYELFYNSNKDLLDSMDKKYTTALQNSMNLSLQALQMAQDQYYKDLNYQIEVAKLYNNSNNSPSPTPTGLSTTDNTKFWNEINTGKTDLQQGEPWGNVWNRIKAQFPGVDNTTIDNALGISWRQPGAAEAYKNKTMVSVSPEDDAIAKQVEQNKQEIINLKNNGYSKTETENQIKSFIGNNTIPADIQSAIDDVYKQNFLQKTANVAKNSLSNLWGGFAKAVDVTKYFWQ